MSRYDGIVPTAWGLWNRVRSSVGMDKPGETGLRAEGSVSEEGDRMPEAKESGIVLALTEEQRRLYERAEKHRQETLEQIRCDGERGCQKILNRSVEENMRKLAFSSKLQAVE